MVSGAQRPCGPTWGKGMPSLPKLSITAKLYVIFALVAAGAVSLAVCAVVDSHRHATLAAKVDDAFLGVLNVERVNGLIYAVVMESRGIYMTPASEMPTVKKYAEGMLRFNDRIGEVVDQWRRTVVPEDAATFEAFAGRMRQFQEFRRELVRGGPRPRQGRQRPQSQRAQGAKPGSRASRQHVRRAIEADLRRAGTSHANECLDPEFAGGRCRDPRRHRRP